MSCGSEQSQLNNSISDCCDENRRRKYKQLIAPSWLATLLRFRRRYLRWAAMGCNGSRSYKIAAKCPISSQRVAGPIVSSWLATLLLFVRGHLRWSPMLLEAQNRREMPYFIAACGRPLIGNAVHPQWDVSKLLWSIKVACIPLKCIFQRAGTLEFWKTSCFYWSNFQVFQ